MAIGTASRNDYVGDGVTLEFAYSFKIVAPTDLKLIVSDANANESDISYPAFSVTGVGSPLGGTITLITALPVGSTLSIERDRPLTQTTDFRNQSGFFPAVHEATFDNAVMLCQRLDSLIRRAVHVREGLNLTDYNLELPEPEAGKALGWDVVGKSLRNLSTTAFAFEGDDADITHSPPGAGAETRTVDEVLAETYRASDYNGAHAGVKIAAAIAALPAEGGTIFSVADGTAPITADPFTAVGTKQITLVLQKQYSFSANVTIPSGVTLRFERGSRITMGVGTTLWVNGGIEAGPYQIFGTTGTVNFVPGGVMGRVHTVYPEWWGANPGGTSGQDNRTELNLAAASLANCEGTMLVREGQYAIKSGGLTATSIRLKGIGNGSHFVFTAACGAVDCLTINTGGRNGLLLENFQITATPTQTHGIVVNDAHFWRMTSVYVNNVGAASTAFRILGSYSGLMENCQIGHCGRGLELSRSGEGSGGVTVVGMLSSDINNIGCVIEDSACISLINCEWNVYGATGFACRIGGMSEATIGITIEGGLYAGNSGGIQIGQVGGAAVLGVKISGAGIGAWTAPAVTSVGITVNMNVSDGVEIGANTYQLWKLACVNIVGSANSGLRVGPIVTSAANPLGATCVTYAQDGVMLELPSVTNFPGAGDKGLPIGSSLSSKQYFKADTPGASGILVFGASGRIHTNTTVVGNVGAGEDDLMSWPMPAGVANQVGRTLRIKAWGDTAANVNPKTLKSYFGGTAVATLGPTAANGKSWVIEYTVAIGPALNTQQIAVGVKGWNGDPAFNIPTSTSLIKNTGDPIVIKHTGEGTDDDDIVQRGFIVWLDQ